MTLSSDAKIALAVGAGIIAFWFILTRKGVAQSVTNATAQAAVGAATGVATGTVQGIGLAVGVPLTDVQLCEIDCAKGDYWNASLHCTAGRFAQLVATGK